MEQWVEIKGYEGYYMVSNLGNVKSLTRTIVRCNGVTGVRRGKSLNIHYNKRVNMYEVHLYKNNKRRCVKIHRLVAENFIHNDDPVNKTTVNHLDGDRSNNSSSNLEWTTQSQNIQHAYDVLKRPINKSTGIKKCKSVDESGNEELYRSIAQASRKTGLSESQIRRLLNKECINKTYKFYYI